MRLLATLVALLLTAAPLRAEPVDDESACGPGGTVLAAFATSAMLTYVGAALADAGPRHGNAGAITFATWGSLVPPLVTAPLVSWLSPGPSRLKTTIPASIAARALLLGSFVLWHAMDPSFSNSDIAGWGSFFASLAGTAVEMALEYRPSTSHFARGTGVRLGFATELANFSRLAVGSEVQYVFLKEGTTFQHGPSIGLGTVWSLPEARASSHLRNLTLDVDWRAEWHRADALGPFAAVVGGPGIGLACTGDFCSPLRASAGGELGFRFPMNETWRLEALVQSRFRLAIGGNPLGEWATSFMLGAI